MAVTNELKATAELVEFTVLRLQSSPEWTTYLLGEKQAEQIPELFPALRLPAAVVAIREADFGNEPLRCQAIDVILCVDGEALWASAKLLPLADKVSALLSGAVCGDSYFRIQYTKPILVDLSLQALQMRFVISDF